MNPIYGIDLGTTNSCIALLTEEGPQPILIEGSPLVKSVVSYGEEGEIIVGTRAANRALLHPDRSVFSIKRHMDRRAEDTTIELEGNRFTPVDVSAQILRYLIEKANESTGQDISRAVITTPAYFSDAGRKATRKAGEMSGLKVERIINEPTAAAMFYGRLNSEQESPKPEEEKILVYDLGGGTFDVSILYMGEIAEVLASCGDISLGGDDFDRKILELLFETIREKEGVDLINYRPALVRLLSVSEKAKIALSAKSFVHIEEASIPLPDGSHTNIKLILERRDFESLINPELNRTMEMVEKALTEAKLGPEYIDKVIMVGGSTRIPKITDILGKYFDRAGVMTIEPELCVAKGAAIQGGVIDGRDCRSILVDITAHSLSVAAMDSIIDELRCVTILPKNTQIPASLTSTFYTLHDNQEKAKIMVYQGESVFPEDNVLLGSVTLLLSSAAKGCPVEVEYSYDSDGIVRVTVEQRGYSRRTEIRLDSQNPETTQDLEALLDDERAAEYGSNFSLSPEVGDSEEIKPLNFILQKARHLIGSLEEMQDKESIIKAVENYETALSSFNEDATDLAEEQLIEILEKMDKK